MILTFPHIRERHPKLFDLIIFAPFRVVIAYVAYGLIASAHVVVRDDAADIGMPYARWVLPVDRLFGIGETPTERLQHLFFAGHLGWLEWMSIGAYVSFFFGPLILLVYLAAFRWRLVVSALLCLAAIYFASDVFFILFPTKPPWMVLGVTRVIVLRHHGLAGIAPYPFAAFPSLHVGVSAGMAMWAWQHREHILAWLLAVQTTAIFFAVVYMGEHYVVDGLAGILLSAGVARVISSHITPLNGRRLA